MPPGSISGVTRCADAAPAVHAVVVALELHAVPVNRRRFRQPVDERDLDRLAALAAPASVPAPTAGRGAAGAIVSVSDEAVGRCVAEARRLGSHRPASACARGGVGRRVRPSDDWLPRPMTRDAEDHARHPGGGPVAVVMSGVRAGVDVKPAVGRDVRHAMWQWNSQLPCPLRRPRHLHRRARPHQLGDDALSLAVWNDWCRAARRRGCRRRSRSRAGASDAAAC